MKNDPMYNLSGDPVSDRRLTYVSRYLERFCPNRASGTLLDCGCGRWEYVSLLTKYNMRCIGFDISQNSLIIARSKITSDCEGVDLIRGDLTDLPFKKGVFDSIICLSNLEHLNNPEKLVQNFSILLKEGGFVIISVPWLWDIWSHPIRAIFHRALDSIHNGCPNFFAKIIFSWIDNPEEPILRKWVSLLIWNDSKRKLIQNYVKVHLTGSLKHLGHKHWFTPNEWIGILQSYGLIIMGSTGSYVVPPGVRRIPCALQLFLRIENHLPKVIRKWLGQSFVIIATKPKLKSNWL